MKLLFTSAALDSSGYAEASRNYICALSKIPEVDLYLRMHSFESWNTEIGDTYGDIINPLLQKRVPVGRLDAQIIHLTPENYRHFIIPGIKNIGYTVWETSKLPPEWVTDINRLDEVWVPCDWNMEVFKNSGVTIPVKKIPHCFNLNTFHTVDIDNAFNIDDSKINFYSIFQWSARKNPEALLKAYYSEFTQDDNVCLVLKTYIDENSHIDKEKIKMIIKKIKEAMWIRNTPPILLINESLSRDEILALHTQCDAFVLPHRAEGWGIPHFEAMAIGNPIISSRYSGNLEFMNDENSLLIDCVPTPCYGMNRPTYNGHMSWGEPSIDHLKRLMRSVYEQMQTHGKEPFKADYKKNTQESLKRFTWENVAELMKKELL